MQVLKLLNTELGNMGHRSLPPSRSYRISQVISLDHFLAVPALHRYLLTPAKQDAIITLEGLGYLTLFLGTLDVSASPTHPHTADT